MKIQNPFSKPTIFVLFPLLLVLVIDLIFTLAGQPEIYWQNYAFYNEGSPLGIFFLSQSPFYFILFFIFYIFFVLFIAANLKRPFNIIWTISFFLGHVWGSATWVDNLFYQSSFGCSCISDWYIKIIYFIFIGIITGIFINYWISKKKINEV